MRRDAVGDDDCLSVKRVIRACVCALRKQTRDPTVVWVREGTAARPRRFDDIQAHVSFTGTGSKDSRLYSLWNQTQIWDPGD